MANELMAQDASAAYAEFLGQIEAAKADNERQVFQYEHPAGNKAARSHIFGLRKIKGAIEARRKEAKSGALEYGRKVDEIAKTLTAEVESMIAVHEGPLLEIENREKARVQAFRVRLPEVTQRETR